MTLAQKSVGVMAEMTKAKVLFVDDEPAVLEGLADMLHKERKRWEMSFVGSGARALEELERTPFDIVVSDMRMPGMDGAQLLARIKVEYPAITRVILSGHSDRESLMRAITVAHQFLTKPCESSVLRSTIERTHKLRTKIENEAVKAAVGRIDRLPSVPRTYLALNEVAADPAKGLADLARVIESDTAMSAKVLQLVSSSYFGTRRDVRTIQQAIGLLGVDLLKGLALTANAFEAASAISAPGFSLERLQQVSMTCARAAKRMAPPALAEEAFTAALVRDIGKIVVSLGMPEEMARVCDLARTRSEPRHVIEKELLGVTHAEVGAYLLGLWGLPFTILEAVAYHHTPSMVTEGNRSVLAIVHAADALISGKPDRLDAPFIDSVGMTGNLPAWRVIAGECVREMPS